MYKDSITQAIQSQQLVKISWQKETTGEYETAIFAPYDVYPFTKKGAWSSRDVMLGVEYENLSYQNHPAQIYLDTIQSVEILDETFNAWEVKRILNPKRQPNIQRNW